MSPKQKRLSKPKRKLPQRTKRKTRQPKSMGGPKGDGVLFPSTRTPTGMDKKTAKKLKKATRYKI